MRPCHLADKCRNVDQARFRRVSDGFELFRLEFVRADSIGVYLPSLPSAGIVLLPFATSLLPKASLRAFALTRLYIRIFSSILLVLALVYAVSNYYMSQLGSQVAMGNLRERFRPIFVLTEDVLAPLARADWLAKFESIKQRFGYDAELIALNELDEKFALSVPVKGLLRAGNILILSRENQMLAARRVADSDVALLLHLPGINDARYYTDAGYLTLWILLFAVLTGLWLIPYRRDLAHMNQVAEKIGVGDFEARAILPKNSALFALSVSFNSMVSRVGQLVRAHKELTTAVSHELRNPLMRLQFRQQLARELETLDEKDRNLDLMGEDLTELERLADELLTYAKLERLEPEIRLDPVDMAALISHAADRARDLALAQGKPIVIKVTANLKHAPGELRYLERAINNLLSNALRHANGVVHISTEQVDGKSQLCVDDDGVGISEAERAQLFEPFSRVDHARARDTGGFGMGLAITRRIARWHGGDIHIEKSPLGGARFVMLW